MTLRREMFLLPQSAVEKLVTRYGYEKLGEFTFLLSQYCAYWDEKGSGEGFDFSHYSDIIVFCFEMCRQEIDEKHRQFARQGEQMAKMATARWDKETKKKERRMKKRQWYVDNSERVNQKRRKNVPSESGREKKKLSSGLSSDSPQGKKTLSVARNDAYAYKNYGIMEHKNFKENYGKGGGELVDKFADSGGGGVNHDLSTGLTGHNRRQAAVINHKNMEHKNHKNGEVENGRTKNLEQCPLKAPHNPPQPCGQLPPGGAELGNGMVRPPPERPTIYAEDWVKIGDDFELDLHDPYFAKFDRATEFLKKGFVMWCRKKLNGQRKDKWWLADQLGRNFTNRQGSCRYMAGRGQNSDL